MSIPTSIFLGSTESPNSAENTIKQSLFGSEAAPGLKNGPALPSPKRPGPATREYRRWQAHTLADQEDQNRSGSTLAPGTDEEAEVGRVHNAVIIEVGDALAAHATPLADQQTEVGRVHDGVEVDVAETEGIRTFDGNVVAATVDDGAVTTEVQVEIAVAIVVANGAVDDRDLGVTTRPDRRAARATASGVVDDDAIFDSGLSAGVEVHGTTTEAAAVDELTHVAFEEASVELRPATTRGHGAAGAAGVVVEPLAVGEHRLVEAAVGREEGGATVRGGVVLEQRVADLGHLGTDEADRSATSVRVVVPEDAIRDECIAEVEDRSAISVR